MKSIATYSALAVAGLSTMVSAELGIAPMLSSYNSGYNAAIDYWADVEYTDVRMQLVHKMTGGWDTYETILHVDQLSPGNNTFVWRVREVAQGEQYGIWISGHDKDSPSTGGELTGYSAISNWFEIRNSPHKAVLSPGGIAGLALGLVVFLSLIVGAVFFVCRRRRASRRLLEMTSAEWRASTDSIVREKERVKAGMSEMKA